MALENQRTKIIIGKKYKEQFNAAERLAEHFSGNGKPQGKSGSEEDGDRQLSSERGYEFVYDPHDEGSARFEDETGIGTSDEGMGFGPQGASWFRTLREGVVSADAEWQTFLGDISGEYHKKYSILEFNRKVSADKKLGNAKRIADALRPLFEPPQGADAEHGGAICGEPQVTPVGASEQGEQDKSKWIVNIYDLTLRIALGDVHDVCHIFFREDYNGTLEPIPYREALELNKMTLDGDAAREQDDRSKANGQDSKSGTRSDSTAAFRDHVLDALARCINNQEPDQNLANYIFFNSQGMDGAEGLEEGESAIVEDQARRYHLENNALPCSEVKVLGISHIEWESSVFKVQYGRNRSVRLMVGLNESITVLCDNCGGDKDAKPLIKNNAIYYKDAYGADAVAVLSIDMQSPRSRLVGLDDATIDLIKRSSAFAEHMQWRKCEHADRKNCAGRIHCASQMFGYTDRYNEVHSYCMDCPYPDVVYKDPDNGTPLATETLCYFVDRNTLDKRDEAKCCSACGRYFETLSDDGRCPLCRKASKGTRWEGLSDKGLKAEAKCEARKNYRRYAHALGLGKRMLGIFCKKYCFTDNERILFVIGKKKYYLKKSDITERGYIEAASRWDDPTD